MNLLSTTKVISLAMSVFPLTGFSQIKDSLAIDVVYMPVPPRQEVLFIINGAPMPDLFFDAIDADRVKDLGVFKMDTLVKGRAFNGVIRVTMKDEYVPSIISLTALKRKYTSLQAGPTVFMWNSQLISGNQDDVLVDEKYIYRIQVNKVADKEEGKYINVVNLLTRSAFSASTPFPFQQKAERKYRKQQDDRTPICFTVHELAFSG